METLYWITTLGNLRVTSIVLLVISMCAMIICFCISQDEEACISARAKASKWLKRILAFTVFLVLVIIFVPSTSDLYIIYGLGNTLDYLKNDSIATQLPHEAIEAIHKYLTQ